MQMSNRIKEIIEVILNSKGYVTVGEIAKNALMINILLNHADESTLYQ